MKSSFTPLSLTPISLEDCKKFLEERESDWIPFIHSYAKPLVDPSENFAFVRGIMEYYGLESGDPGDYTDLFKRIEGGIRKKTEEKVEKTKRIIFKLNRKGIVEVKLVKIFSECQSGELRNKG